MGYNSYLDDRVYNIIWDAIKAHDDWKEHKGRIISALAQIQEELEEDFRSKFVPRVVEQRRRADNDKGATEYYKCSPEHQAQLDARVQALFE